VVLVNNVRIREDGIPETFQNVDNAFRLYLTLPSC